MKQQELKAVKRSAVTTSFIFIMAFIFYIVSNLYDFKWLRIISLVVIAICSILLISITKTYKYLRKN